ncbi:uncharacterized protein LOC110752859 [Prunus avium]|uniref:Uncharacterized protein LOC110752859 n=1 Tax=Prunus avium TaxID=42229 RepID=A0A6P5S173_PRUAV|nr:uncharacterized protein LOC110752859 [Prunus avium]
MPPRKNTISNTVASQEELNHGDSTSRGNRSREEERPTNGEEYTLPELIAAIHAMSKSQREIIETMKELKNSVSNQNDKNEEQREKTPLENSADAGRGSEQKEASLSPMKMKGSPKEHISRFVDALGPYAGDYNLRVREFSKSLTNRAYTWYTTLAPGSICSWEDLASRFYRKYFQHEERVTTTQLNNTRQKPGENSMDFVRRFRDLALDCYDEKDEEALVEIFISNIVPEYRVYLENIGIN